MAKYRGSSVFEYILFDLDETLYPREAGVMKVISERSLCYMTQKMGIPADDATAKKHLYYQKYGTVLRGLMEEHHVNPNDYLNFVHDFDPKEFLVPSCMRFLCTKSFLLTPTWAIASACSKRCK